MGGSPVRASTAFALSAIVLVFYGLIAVGVAFIAASVLASAAER
jgi:hypothetical protein